MTCTRHATALTALLLVTTAQAVAQQAPLDLYRQAREHLIDERLTEALPLFQQIVSDHPRSEQADDAQYYVGYVRERLEHDRDAVAAFQLLLDRWPGSPRAESARARLAVLMGRTGSGASGELRTLLESSAPWEVKRETALALARARNLSAAAVLEEIMQRERSSRRLELLEVLSGLTADPVALRIVAAGLTPGNSSSVKLKALDVLRTAAARPEVTALVEPVLERRESSSVQHKAVQILSAHVGAPRVRRAVAAALSQQNNSSRVRLLACQVLAGRMVEPEVAPAVLRLFRGGTSSSVQLAALESLAPSIDDPRAAPLLAAAVGPDISTRVQRRAMQLAAASREPRVRAVGGVGMASASSSSVQMDAIRVYLRTRDEPAASEALRDFFRRSGVSTSAQLLALDALERHMGTPAAPGALSAALAPSNSSRVLTKGVRLAAGHTARPAVREAVRLLLSGDVSSSVQLAAIDALSGRSAEAHVRAIVAAALDPGRSTRVNLKSVEVLAPHAGEADARDALTRVLAPGYSTSVVFAAMRALEHLAGSDRGVRAAFLSVLEHGDLSYRVRIRAGDRLSAQADAAERLRIADAMEEVISRIRREHWGRWTRAVVENALDVLGKVDPARAEALAR